MRVTAESFTLLGVPNNPGLSGLGLGLAFCIRGVWPLLFVVALWPEALGLSEEVVGRAFSLHLSIFESRISFSRLSHLRLIISRLQP